MNKWISAVFVKYKIWSRVCGNEVKGVNCFDRVRQTWLSACLWRVKFYDQPAEQLCVRLLLSSLSFSASLLIMNMQGLNVNTDTYCREPGAGRHIACICVLQTLQGDAVIIIIIIIIMSLVTALSSRYVSWTSGEPHRSGFKFHSVVLSAVCVMFQV